VLERAVKGMRTRRFSG